MSSVALPEPQDIASDDFLESLEALVRADAESVQTVVDDVQRGIMGEVARGTWDSSVEAEFVGISASGTLLAGTLSSVDDLRHLLECIDLRWRLDASHAVEVLAGEFAEEDTGE